MTGRPSEFNQSTADAICERIVGQESLRAICLDPEMPSATTVFKWLAAFPGFAEQYARAKSEQTEINADEIVAISDEPVACSEDAQRNRLRVDARKWVAAKLLPKKYGERQTTEHELSGDTLGALLAALDGKSRGLPGKE